jgi:hypothetical protein
MLFLHESYKFIASVNRRLAAPKNGFIELVTQYATGGRAGTRHRLHCG